MVTRIPLSTLTERYSFVDPNSGKQANKDAKALRRTRARAAIVTAAVDDLGRKFIVQSWASRCSTDELTEQIFKVNETWKPRIFGVEGVALQTLYANSLAREARQRGISLPVAACEQPTRVDKNARIRAWLAQEFAQGLIFFGPGQEELENEVKVFPHSPLKDLIDALASLCHHLVPPRASATERSTEREDRLAYLRDTGAPLWYIEQVAKGLDPAEVPA